MATNRNFPRFRATRNSGAPGNGWKLWSYAAGTTTPKATYSDQGGLTANANPLILDGAGEGNVWLAAGGYKLVLSDENDVVQWTVDNLDAGEFVTLTVTGAATLATISASGVITSTVATGAAPFVVASTTKVANLNADLLKGKTWDAPDPVGATTPSTGKFTTLEATGTLTAGGGILIPLGANEIMNTPNGGSWQHRQIAEEITLSTAGTTTDSIADLLPANSIIEAVIARVQVAIVTATSWALGDSVQSARFLTATTDLVLGTQKIGFNQMKGAVASDALGPTQDAAAKMRVTTVGTPSAGKVRVEVFYMQFIAPGS